MINEINNIRVNIKYLMLKRNLERHDKRVVKLQEKLNEVKMLVQKLEKEMKENNNEK